MAIHGVTDNMTAAQVQFAFVLLPSSPTGTYNLKVVVWDAEENESNHLSTQFELK